MTMIQTIDEAIERIAADEREIGNLRDAIRGIMWMLDGGAFGRSTKHDAESDYAIRSIRFVAWLRELDALARRDA